MEMQRTDEFFAFARKRHQIYLDKVSGKPYPWTDDWILQQYSFTNVFRELDKVTVWFRENVREELRAEPEALLAVALFRWFNRPNVGEAIFKQTMFIGMDEISTAWDHYLKYGDSAILKATVLNACGKGPYVNGAYIILGQQGMPKLPGVLACVDIFNEAKCYSFQGRPCHWLEVAESCLASPHTLESIWLWLRQFPYLGDFMAYEIVTDLRFTDIGCNAPDISTWANPGPGAARGLARVTNRGVRGRAVLGTVGKRVMIDEMRELLRLSRRKEYWPQRKGWPALEMREIEHTLCEFDKYERTRTGEGKPKAVYRHKG